MKFDDALEALKKGHKVTLPEWFGYWHLSGGIILAHTQDDRDIVATHFQTNVFRNDWEIFGGEDGLG